MAYDYSSENKSLELPNPYRVENGLLFASAAILVAGGVTALMWAREALQSASLRLGAAPLLVGIALLAAGIAFAVPAARRLRFFFGRGRPASLAPEVAIGATGNSGAADAQKAMLRQGGIECAEPQGALNGLLYHLAPRLITAPRVVQELAQRHFFNALAFAATGASFVVAWGLFANAATRPLIGLAYLVFAAVVLLKPLVAGAKAAMTTTSLIALMVVAVVGPVSAGLLAGARPAFGFEVHGQAFFLLGAALLAVALILLAVFAQVDAPPPTERSCEQLTLSMNGPPGALLTELDRRLQNEWTQNIPNRRYTRLEPVTEGAAGSGRFAGELLEESQPMPLTGTTAPTLFGGLAVPRHRWLVALDLYATLLVLAGVAFALNYVRGFDPARLLEGGLQSHAAIGYSAICLVVAAFCFQSAGSIWGRFNFESVLVWVEMLGTWQASRIGTGNQLSSRLHSDNEVVRVESMTLRVWRARLESVVFGKDSARQVVAMFGTAQEARELGAELSAFAARQSVFVAPQSEADAQRLGRLQSTEALLAGGAAAPGLAAAPAHEALRVAAAHGARYCSECGAPAAAGAKFCSACGVALA
ncbi:MAG: zinc ribbon domain-containing protein [Burkholderiales bacterium]|nr:zinc ribbon domain-containing protein [Burkholderiales bacterium]